MRAASVRARPSHLIERCRAMIAALVVGVRSGATMEADNRRALHVLLVLTTTRYNAGVSQMRAKQSIH